MEDTPREITQSKQQPKKCEQSLRVCGTAIEDWTFLSSEHWKERRAGKVFKGNPVEDIEVGMRHKPINSRV